MLRSTERDKIVDTKTSAARGQIGLRRGIRTGAAPGTAGKVAVWSEQITIGVVHDSEARRIGRHGIDRRHAQRLAKPFIVAKNECTVLLDRPPSRAPELIAPERRDHRAIEIVPGVERTIAQKLIKRTVKRVLPGTGHHVDHTARSSPVIGWIVAPENGHLLDRVNPQIVTQNAARGAVRVVVDADSIQAVTVLVRPRSGNAHRRSKSAVGVAASRRTAILHAGDAGL